MINNVKPVFDPVAADAAIRTIQSLDFETASIDEIKDLLKPILRGYSVNIVTIASGSKFYQVAVGNKPSKVSELGCLSGEIANAGLAHTPGEHIFYVNRQAAFIESGARLGDTLTIAHWVATTDIDVNHAGYTQSVFDSLNSQRLLPSINPDSPFILPESYEQSVKFVASAFVPSVQGLEPIHNKVTTALAELLLSGKPPLPGMIYPSAILHAQTDNMILKPEARKTLGFEKAEFIRIESFDKVEDRYNFTILDTAPELSSKGVIEWYGGRVGEPPKRYGTVGWEEFLRQKKDILSAYDSAKEANANRPMQTEHGNVGEAKFRTWLGESLPKKYGVTSGFIIPDSRSMNYELRHYDVIVYDYLNSPILWASSNPDKSDQGRERAIPAKYVHAVFEVKSSFTKQNANKALEKLGELNLYKDHLTETFICAVVFFEVKQEDQSKSKLAGSLYKGNIPGYFGGLILRAEGIDPNVTGYYTLQESEDQTPDIMPFVQAVDNFNSNTDGSNGIVQGNYVVAVDIDMVWNFDIGYYVQVDLVRLRWSYNNFSYFFLELLRRLDGTYNLTDFSKQGHYGLSFIRHGGAIIPNASILKAE